MVPEVVDAVVDVAAVESVLLLPQAASDVATDKAKHAITPMRIVGLERTCLESNCLELNCEFVISATSLDAGAGDHASRMWRKIEAGESTFRRAGQRNCAASANQRWQATRLCSGQYERAKRQCSSCKGG